MLIDRVSPSNRTRAMGMVWPDALRIRGSVIRITFPAVFLLTGYGVGIAFLIRKYEYLALQIAILTPVAVVLSLLLVFRTNSAYDRFWEGRKIWQDLKVNSRNMIRNTWCGVVEKSIEDSVQKRQALKNVAAFMISIKHYIRGEDGLDYADYDGLLSPEFRMQVLARRSAHNYGSIGGSINGSIGGAHNSPNRGQSSSELRIQQQQSNEGWERTVEVPFPSLLLYEIQKFVEYLMDNGVVHGQLYVNMLSTVNSMGTLLGGCERIISTPIPMAYHIHLHHSLYLYLLVLPWALGSMGLAKTIILQFIISFMMIGIDAISREIQNPFGYDANDLDLDAFCEAMLVELNYALNHQAPKALEVVENTLTNNTDRGKNSSDRADATSSI